MQGEIVNVYTSIYIYVYICLCVCKKYMNKKAQSKLHCAKDLKINKKVFFIKLKKKKVFFIKYGEINKTIQYIFSFPASEMPRLIKISFIAIFSEQKLLS